MKLFFNTIKITRSKNILDDYLHNGIGFSEGCGYNNAEEWLNILNLVMFNHGFDKNEEQEMLSH